MLTANEPFLASVRQSQLVAPEVLGAWLEKMAGPGGSPQGPEQLAEGMVRDGLLTNFQAKQLLRSRWQGFLIGGKYRVLELLGVGGMGRVFLCEHVRMRNLVAVKVLPPEGLSEPTALERFNREARAAANLVHPNLVRAFDIDDDGQFHFLVLEYVYGTTLHQLVARKGPLPVPFAAEVIRQAALGLQHAHEHGLVHRDVKPGNILLDHAGTVKVLDLGLARFFRDTADHLTEEQEGTIILGTADYLAPEQALDSHAVGAPADVYSLGATFYFCLTGQAPFEEAPLAQKMIWHQVRQPPAIHASRSDVPPQLEEVVSRMMAKEPAQRYAHLGEVAEALGQWAAGPVLPAEDDLPAWCPAVRRLLPESLVGAGSGPRLSPSAPTPRPLPGRLSRARRWRALLVVGAAGVVGLALIGASSLASRLLVPAPAPLPRSPDLHGINPLTGIDQHKAIAAPLAVGQVGQTRTVCLSVKDRDRDGRALYFFSDKVRTRKGEEKRRKVFTVAILRSALDKFKAVGVADPYAFYQGALIEVTGTIKYLSGGFEQPGIEVTSPDQIKIVHPD
jgi:serine/threonine protein kinase